MWQLMHAADCHLKVWLRHDSAPKVTVLVHELTKRVYRAWQLRHHQFEQFPGVMTRRIKIVCGQCWRGE